MSELVPDPHGPQYAPLQKRVLAGCRRWEESGAEFGALRKVSSASIGWARRIVPEALSRPPFSGQNVSQ